MTRILPTALLCAPLALLSTPAVAEEQGPPCAPYDQVAAELAGKYQVTRIAQGIVGEGQAMLVIFSTPQGETWSAVMVKPDGMACMAAAGMDWQVRSDPAPVQEEAL